MNALVLDVTTALRHAGIAGVTREPTVAESYVPELRVRIDAGSGRHATYPAVVRLGRLDTRLATA